MTYAIIGAGNVGTALARQFARQNIPVRIANSRGPETIAQLVAELGAAIQPTTIEEALEADVIFLALYFIHVEELARPDDGHDSLVSLGPGQLRELVAGIEAHLDACVPAGLNQPFQANVLPFPGNANMVKFPRPGA